MGERQNDGQLPPISGAGRPEGGEESVATPQIEGYEITGRLGQGGMGTVWAAVQLSTSRDVALKLLGRGAFATEKERARFEREVELTARLQHPNIAQVFDSGLRHGVYFYAMELVQGVALDEFVKQHELSQRQILELMQKVCEAVQHAHERGVIHRDLKPSNVLVTGDGRPHVLDFGLAKAFLEQDYALTEASEEAGGTPAYMSPEQASGKLDQVDTRTDVYALGVVLFRLLTGDSPHDLSGTRYEVLRRIAEEDVRRPREITKDIDKELEALLLKALARDPKGRYASAGVLAQDMENYLSGEPLTARPPTAAYFLRKRLWKHRLPFTIACSVLALLIGMAVFAYVRITRARDSLQKEVDKAKATDDFMQSIFTSLHVELQTRDTLDLEARRAPIQFPGQPEVEAAVRMEIGNVYILRRREAEAACREFSRALDLRRKFLGKNHPDTLLSMEMVAASLWLQGKFHKAERMYREVIAAREIHQGPRHRETMNSKYNLSERLKRAGKLDEALPFRVEAFAVDRAQLGEKHPDTLYSKRRVGTLLWRMGRLDDADRTLREVLDTALDPLRDDRLLDCFDYLGAVLLERENLEHVEALFREAVRSKRDHLGDDHQWTLLSMNSLALVLRRRGKQGEAEAWNERIVKIRRDRDGEDHPGTRWASGNLASPSDLPYPPPGPGGSVLARDDFNGKLSLDWQVLQPDPSHFSPTINPGTLTITTQEGDPLDLTYRTFENLFLIDCPTAPGADFQLTTCITSFDPVAEWHQAGLIIHNDDERLAFTYGAFGFREFSIGASYMGAPEFGYARFTDRRVLNSIWLRITKRGNRYTFSVSLDGDAFDPLQYPDLDRTGLFQGNVVLGDGSVRRVGLFAVNGESVAAPEIDASFDFFEVRALAPEAELEHEMASTGQEERNVKTR